MEIPKLPIEKTILFLAGVIPGGAAIFIYQLANPTSFDPFLQTDVIGYGTKLGIAIGLCFVVGNSITALMNSLLGAIGGAIGAVWSGKKPSWPDVPDSAPWRDPQWRRFARFYLADQTPPDTLPMSDSVFKMQMDFIKLVPEAERPQKTLDLQREKFNLASDDHAWGQLYSHLDNRRQAEEQSDFTALISNGLYANCEATAIYILISMIFVPSVRNWFCVLFSLTWILGTVARTYTLFHSYLNPWSTWSRQMAFLTQKFAEQRRFASQESSQR